MGEKSFEMIEEYSEKGAELRRDFFASSRKDIDEISKAISVCLIRGGKVLFCGNGGSAADAQHLAAEFINKFRMDRPPLPALALSTDSSVLTSISNDFSFEEVFAKQVKALGQEGDILVGITTSGKSQNVIQALKCGNGKGMICVGMTSEYRDSLKFCDYTLRVNSNETSLVQELHISAGHVICMLVDYYLFEAVDELEPFL